jgi:hypothetical protein
MGAAWRSSGLLPFALCRLLFLLYGFKSIGCENEVPAYFCVTYFVFFYPSPYGDFSCL